MLLHSHKVPPVECQGPGAAQTHTQGLHLGLTLMRPGLRGLSAHRCTIPKHRMCMGPCVSLVGPGGPGYFWEGGLSLAPAFQSAGQTGSHSPPAGGTDGPHRPFVNACRCSELLGTSGWRFLQVHPLPRQGAARVSWGSGTRTSEMVPSGLGSPVSNPRLPAPYLPGGAAGVQPALPCSHGPVPTLRLPTRTLNPSQYPELWLGTCTTWLAT